MDVTDYREIRWEVEDGVLTLTLDRPEQLNAFTPRMADELEDAFVRVNAVDEVRAVVVTGAGRAFCAGMDLTAEGNVFGLDESLRPTAADLVERFDDPAIVSGVRDTGGRVSLAIAACLKPVIAAVNGPAVGIGATMTCAMDARLAADTARIGFVFGRLGIVPEACSTWFLPRIVGMARALEWVYTAEVLDAATALQGGLLRSVHPPEQLLDEARALAHRFTDGRSLVATALTRRMLYDDPAFASPVEAHRAESLAMFYTSTGDGKEGVAAFREKRAPRFSSRLPQDLPEPWRR